MDYQLWHGDCLEQMDRIESGSVDMILADLPYNVTNCHWDTLIPFEPLWKQYKRVIKRNGAVVLFGSEPFSSLLRLSNLAWYRYDWVWEKEQGTGNLNANKIPLKRHENILVFYHNLPIYNPQMSKGSPYSIKRTKNENIIFGKTGTKDGYLTINQGERYPTTLLEFSRELTNRLHPTQKPVALLSYLVKTYTNEGDLILDNTAGSGSTLEAAMRCNRCSIGIEKDLNYFNVATQRLARVAAELRGELNHLPMFQEAVAV